MTSLPVRFRPRELVSVIACLLVLACSDSGSDKPSATAGGTSGGTAAAGTAASPPPGNAGTGTGTAGGSTSTGSGGTGTGTAGRGAPGGGGRGGDGRGPGGGGSPGSSAAGGGAAGTTPEPGPPGAASVLQYHKNSNRDGAYVDAAFTRAAAAMLKKDTTFTASIAGPTYAQPLYFEGGPGGQDLIITATEQNEVTAFDAANGMMVWRKMLAAPATSGLPCGRINPLGVTGTPVIDAASRTLYIAAMTTGPKHQIYALALDDGNVKAGWPVDVDSVTSTGGKRFTSPVQNQRGALLIVGDMLYVPYGGHFGDCGDYRGWVVGVPLSNPSAPIGFATAAKAGGIWAPGGLASDGTFVYGATGNTMAEGGGFQSTPSTWGHGNAILKLGKDLKNIAEGQTSDFFAAENWSALDRADLDLGGSGPVLVSVPGATPADLLVALGKDGAAYLINRTNLGGMGGEIGLRMVSSGGIGGGMIQAATSYTTTAGTFVAFRSVQRVMGCGTGSGFVGALKVEAGSPPTMNVAWCAGVTGNGSPISTTTDGKSESIVWYVAGGKLYGFNGENGMPVYNGGGAMDGTGTASSFQTPIVAKGRIFFAANNAVVAYTLK